MFRWGLVLAVGGCAQLAGIDNTRSIDAGAPNVSSLQLEHVAIGKTVIKGPQDATMLAARFLVPDPAAPGGLREVTPTRSGLDTWLADTGGLAVPVQYESPELPVTNLRILDLGVATVRAAVPVLEHPLPEPAPMGATITVNVALDGAQAGQTYQLFTVGAWAAVGLAAPAAAATQLAPGPVTLTEANTPTRRLDKLTVDDAVLVLRYAGNQLVSSLVAAPFDQGAAQTITGTLTATPLDQQLDIRVDQNAAAQRLSTVRPAVGAPTYNWNLRAAPGLDYNIVNGPLLHAASVAAPAAPDPQTLTATYGNPFAADFPSVLTWDVRGTRTYTAPDTSTVALAAGLFERARPTAGLAVALAAGLPDRITANTTVLNVDNMTVSAPADAPVEVSFVTDATTNTMYNVELFSLVPDGMLALTRTKLVTISAVAPTVKIPRALFQDGTLYVLRAISFSGCFPAIAAGDLAQQTLPCAVAFADSGVFQVVTP